MDAIVVGAKFLEHPKIGSTLNSRGYFAARLKEECFVIELQNGALRVITSPRAKSLAQHCQRVQRQHDRMLLVEEGEQYEVIDLN